jgi:hypothetical protein
MYSQRIRRLGCYRVLRLGFGPTQWTLVPGVLGSSRWITGSEKGDEIFRCTMMGTVELVCLTILLRHIPLISRVLDRVEVSWLVLQFSGNLEPYTIVTGVFKAIVDRGWGPLNYALLRHPDLQDSDRNTVDNQLLHANMPLEKVNLESGEARTVLEKILVVKYSDKQMIESLK